MSYQFVCPGSRSLKESTPKYINCPKCGGELEIWSDELKTNCPHCKAVVFKGNAPTCIEWCKYAKECVGEELYNRFKGAQ